MASARFTACDGRKVPSGYPPIQPRRFAAHTYGANHWSRTSRKQPVSPRTALLRKPATRIRMNSARLMPFSGRNVPSGYPLMTPRSCRERIASYAGCDADMSGKEKTGDGRRDEEELEREELDDAKEDEDARGWLLYEKEDEESELARDEDDRSCGV